jgi:hypothetical protein
MVKKWLPVGIATLAFIFVWIIVIISIMGSKQNALYVQNLVNIERSYFEKIKDEDFQIPKRKIVSVGSVIPDKEKIVINERYTKDLRTIDFSDIDSKDGVPVDIVLSRLGIN